MTKENGNGTKVTLEYIRRDIEEIKEDIKDLKDDFITRAEFEPVKKLVYGIVALVLTGVISAVLGLVLISRN
jgi:hypothetical protein